MSWPEYWNKHRTKALASGDRMKHCWAQWAYENNHICLEERNRLLDN